MYETSCMLCVAVGYRVQYPGKYEKDVFVLNVEEAGQELK
jgi:hypothetical protein